MNQELSFYESGKSYYDYIYEKYFPNLVEKGYVLSGVVEVTTQFYGKANFLSMLRKTQIQQPTRVIKIAVWGSHYFILVRDLQ